MSYNRQHPLYIDDLAYISSYINFSWIQNKCILITGANGLIGSCIVDTLMHLNTIHDLNINIYCLVRNKAKATAHFKDYLISDLFHLIVQDIQIPCTHEARFDIIIHAASNAHPIAYATDPIGTISTNIYGTNNMLERAYKDRAQIMYISTIEVYGNARHTNDIFDESYCGNLNLTNSRNGYPESKRLCEVLCQSYIEQLGVQANIVRLCRTFGPTMSDSDSKATAQFLKCAKKKQNIPLKSTGTQLFSYIYVADAVSAIFHLLQFGEVGQPYNISNQFCNTTLYEFANICAKAVGQKIRHETLSAIEKQGVSHAACAIMSNHLLVKSGWHPQYSLTTAIQRTLDILI